MHVWWWGWEVGRWGFRDLDDGSLGGAVMGKSARG